MLTAVVIAYKSEATIDFCISSALDAGVDRVIVWDNSPLSSTKEHLLSQEHGPKLSVHGDHNNTGFGKAINAVVENLVDDSDLIILLNPDCILNSDCVDSIVALAQETPNGLVAPRMKYPGGRFGYAGGAAPKLLKELLALTNIDEKIPKSAKDFAVRTITARRGVANYTESTKDGDPLIVDWVSGFCVAVRATVFKHAGGFDPDFFLYFEDVDLSLRVKKLGYRNYVDRRVHAVHFESQSTGPSGKNRHYRNGMWTYFLKWGSRPERTLAAIAARLSAEDPI